MTCSGIVQLRERNHGHEYGIKVLRFVDNSYHGIFGLFLRIRIARGPALWYTILWDH